MGKFKRSKSNKSNKYEKGNKPENAFVGSSSELFKDNNKIHVSVSNPEHKMHVKKTDVIKRNNKIKHDNKIKCNSKIKCGVLSDKSSAFWDTLDDNVQYLEETDWSKPRTISKPITEDLSKPKTFWDTLGDDVEYIGDTDWSEFKKSITVVVEADADDKQISSKSAVKNKHCNRKHHNRNVGKSKRSSSFNIRRCKKCMLDCEYSAYLCGLPINKTFAFNKSTCPK